MRMPPRRKPVVVPVLADDVVPKQAPTPMPPPQTPAQDLPYDPFEPQPHIAAMIDRSIVFAPLVVHWTYRVASLQGFREWLMTRDIVLGPARLRADPRLSGLRYGGTYFSSPFDDQDQAANTRTVWGYDSNEAMAAMHDLCSGKTKVRSIVENDLLGFVTELGQFIAQAGTQHFQQHVLVSASQMSNLPAAVDAGAVDT